MTVGFSQNGGPIAVASRRYLTTVSRAEKGELFHRGAMRAGLHVSDWWQNGHLLTVDGVQGDCTLVRKARNPANFLTRVHYLRFWFPKLLVGITSVTMFVIGAVLVIATR